MNSRVTWYLGSFVLFAALTAQPLRAQTTWYVDDNAPNDPGPGDPSVSDPQEDGSAGHPYDAIQEGIDAAAHGDVVIVLNGTYVGSGNREMSFAGRQITVRSENGSETCLIDCEGVGRAFLFQTGETRNSVIEGFTLKNGSEMEGGAICCEPETAPTIRHCTFVGNLGSFGGALFVRHSRPLVERCVFVNNAALIGGAVNSDLQSEPEFVDCVLRENSASDEGGAMHLRNTVVSLNRCVISTNVAERHGGGIYVPNDVTIRARNCEFTGNVSNMAHGGGIYLITERIGSEFVNCVIANNSAWDKGGGIYSAYASVRFINCTIADNASGREGGGIRFEGSSSEPGIYNSILWGNTAGDSSQISAGSARLPATLHIAYSDIQDGQAGIVIHPSEWTLDWGPRNIAKNPLFVDASGADYRLAHKSPCIDAGDNDAVPSGVLCDLSGNPRFLDDPLTDDSGNGTAPLVDTGAYEYQIVRAFVDIRPGSCPNPLNLNSHGLLPVAIAGTGDFDVCQIDIDTLAIARLDRVGGSISPLQGPHGPRVRVEDVATPFDGTPCDCHELRGDGMDDLSMKFRIPKIVAELELDGLPGGATVELVVSGMLLDGTAFAGVDCVQVVPPHVETLMMIHESSR